MLGFFFFCSCQHCLNYLTSFTALRNLFRAHWLETDMAISSVVHMVSDLGCRNITQTLKEPLASQIQSPERTSGENNQHLPWERSTVYKVRREWSGTSATDILQKTNKWQRSDLWLQRNPVEQWQSQQLQDKYIMHFHNTHTPTHKDICVNILYTHWHLYQATVN